MPPLTVTSHNFTAPGKVSLWTTTRPIEGLHRDFLEGCDQLFMWLLVDYDVAIDGAFATNYTADGALQPLQKLLDDLHASESFSKSAAKAATEKGMPEASFVVALYDCDYQPAHVGLPSGDHGSAWLSFVGAFAYEE